MTRGINAGWKHFEILKECRNGLFVGRKSELKRAQRESNCSQVESQHNYSLVPVNRSYASRYFACGRSFPSGARAPPGPITSSRVSNGARFAVSTAFLSSLVRSGAAERLMVFCKALSTANVLGKRPLAPASHCSQPAGSTVSFPGAGLQGCVWAFRSSSCQCLMFCVHIRPPAFTFSGVSGNP